MKRFYLALFLLLFAITGYSKSIDDVTAPDTNEVITLNKQAYDARLTNPEQTVYISNKALTLAMKLNYNNGIGEAYRDRGIGQYYLNSPDEAIDSYISALTYFDKGNNLAGKARVDNNIGNLYRDNDYDKSLEYFRQALAIGNKISNKSLIATAYLNLGNIYSRKKSFNQALKFYNNSQSLFNAIHDSVNVIQCSQNEGVAYFNLNELDKAEQLLKDANAKAKDKDLNESVASIDLTLATLYLAENKFDDAQRVVTEGLAYAQIVKDQRFEYDFDFTNYLIELKRKNYEKALYYLHDCYQRDSIDGKVSFASQINLFKVRHDQEEQQREADLQVQRNYYIRVRFWGASMVAGLLLVVIALLINNVKRKAKTNAQLTDLNGEVLRQKENLDRVNHHLEEIIDDRTKDLQIKNKKLSEYSSYLSHQIRGPIATLKGLMNLEKEGLVDQQECINMMDKCVSEIDEKIIEMSDMMHDPAKTPFSSR